VNGPHDLGGAQGFEPIAPEESEPVFHHGWERRVLGMVLAMSAAGAWSIDTLRHARERIPPADYLRSSYYEIWLKGMGRALKEAGLISEAELAAGHAFDAARALPRRPRADEVPAMLAGKRPYTREPQAAALFKAGDRVQARVMHPPGHTRLPRYLRGRAGRIERVHGAHVFPDANAHGRGEDPQWLYTVVFDAREVWGPEARTGDTLSADLWEPYLERA
jgi:nitrile hydratase